MAKSLARWSRVEVLREKLNGKAKVQPRYRFYSLYDKVYRRDILEAAYSHCRQNGGGPGVDGVTFRDIESYGVECYLAELEEELKEKKYVPQAVKRVMIEKENQPGSFRPLGIPTIRDRIVQMAVKLLLEPIFEADFPENLYGYRPGRSARDAIESVDQGLRHGQYHVVDGDVTKYFDRIPHEPLMLSVSRRIADSHILWLLRKWLKAPVHATNKNGKTVVEGGRSLEMGTPQGGVISPLLANIYIRRFLLAWEHHGYTDRYGSRIVNYADDFVILCKRDAHGACRAARRILARIGLTLSERKTRVVRAWHDSFDFLGYRFGLEYGQDGRTYLGKRPSDKNVKKYRDKVFQLTNRGTRYQSPWLVAHKLEQTIRGFWTYFQWGSVSQLRHRLDQYLKHRMFCWAQRKYPKSRGRRPSKRRGQAQRWSKIRAAIRRVKYSRHVIAQWREKSLFAGTACYAK